MKNFTLTTLFLVLTSISWGQCSANFTFSVDSSNNSITVNYSSTTFNFGDSIQVNYGDGVLSSEVDPAITNSFTHIYSNSGIYNVCLTMYGGGCHDTVCQTITVGNTSVPCVIDASFSVDSIGGLTYTFTSAEDTNGTNACDVEWNFGDGSPLQYGWQVNHTYSQQGIYTVCSNLINCTNGCSDSACLVITVGNNPNICNVEANYNWFQAYDSLNGSWVNTVYVVDYSVGNNLSYEWSFGDGATSSQQFPTHSYNSIGEYIVCLTVTDTDSCTSTFCDTILVQTKASGFTLQVISQSAVGMEEINSLKLGKLYPNPTSENAFVSINSSEFTDVDLSIVDLSGKVIFQEFKSLTIGENVLQLNTIDLTSGIYFISITSDKGFNTNLRLIKK